MAKVKKTATDVRELVATSEKKSSQKCCICGSEITGFDNNPWPLRANGRCCDACNELVVSARGFFGSWLSTIGDITDEQTAMYDIEMDFIKEKAKKYHLSPTQLLDILKKLARLNGFNCVRARTKDGYKICFMKLKKED